MCANCANCAIVTLSYYRDMYGDIHLGLRVAYLVSRVTF